VIWGNVRNLLPVLILHPPVSDGLVREHQLGVFDLLDAIYDIIACLRGHRRETSQGKARAKHESKRLIEKHVGPK